MDAATMARGLLREGHDMIEQALDGLSDEQLHARSAGSTVAPIGLVYLHAVTGEDWVINELIGGGPSIWDREGWAERLGLPGDLPTRADWGDGLRIADVGAVRAAELRDRRQASEDRRWLGDCQPEALPRRQTAAIRRPTQRRQRPTSALTKMRTPISARKSKAK